VTLLSLSLFLLVSFSYYYLFAAVILFNSMVVFSVFFSLRNHEKNTDGFTLTEFGVISLKDQRLNYQLLPDTRLSFLGYWLVLQPIEGNSSLFQEHTKLPLKHLFIYRDRLSGQDLSRLVRVVKSLS
jgi:hypothetical protein